MVKLLFVCHGNICRSPMAEFIMKDLVMRAGLAREFLIASAGTSREELGNPIYPPAQRLLLLHGIDPSGKTARQIDKSDYLNYHYLIGMDSANVRNMRHYFNGDPASKVLRLSELTSKPRDIEDPWYTGDFEQTWNDVTEGCLALLTYLKEIKS